MAERAAGARAARIVVMDDDAMVRRAVGTLLRSLGHEVELAEDGASAVEKYREAMRAGQRFDAAILDLTVRGGLGGVEAVSELLRIDPDVRAIVSSGYSDEPAVADCHRYGFRAALQKPYTVAEMEAVLAKVLG
jgi:CheY-like chemotaxis protein